MSVQDILNTVRSLSIPSIRRTYDNYGATFFQAVTFKTKQGLSVNQQVQVSQPQNKSESRSTAPFSLTPNHCKYPIVVHGGKQRLSFQYTLIPRNPDSME